MKKLEKQVNKKDLPLYSLFLCGSSTLFIVPLWYVYTVEYVKENWGPGV